MNYIKTIGSLFIAILMQFSVQAQSSLDTYFDHLSENRKFMGSAAILFKDSIIYNKSVLRIQQYQLCVNRFYS